MGRVVDDTEAALSCQWSSYDAPATWASETIPFDGVRAAR